MANILMRISTHLQKMYNDSNSLNGYVLAVAGGFIGSLCLGFSAYALVLHGTCLEPDVCRDMSVGISLPFLISAPAWILSSVGVFLLEDSVPVYVKCTFYFAALGCSGFLLFLLNS